MAHLIKTEQFALEISTNIFESDIALPSNTIMDVIVESDGFIGNASMDIDAKELAKFAHDLEKLYEKLSGEARIEEPYGLHMYISFTGNGRGQIAVKGCLNKGNCIGSQQELQFENEIDQTVLKSFSADLVESYGKYI